MPVLVLTAESDLVVDDEPLESVLPVFFVVSVFGVLELPELVEALLDDDPDDVPLL